MKKMKDTLFVSGMSCSACELRIENKLSALSGVYKATASLSRSTVEVEFDSDTISMDRIKKAIEETGYTVESAPRGVKPLSSKKAKPESSVIQVLGILVVIFALYMVISHTIGFNFIPNINEKMGYGILFVVGLVTSLHCLAMCGGINLSQNVKSTAAKGVSSKGEKLMTGLLYNGGRVISYTLIGGIVGAIGSVISFSGVMRGIVAIISGIFMMIMGLNMLGLPWFSKFSIRMPKFISRRIHSSRTPRGPFFVGLLNGLMPCGPLQTMQLYALGTGSFWGGAFSMLMFSLGTVPLMFLFGAVSAFLSSKLTHKMLKVSAALVMVLGFVMLSRGLGLSGIQVGKAAAAANTNVATVQGNVQEITTSLSSGQYTPITVQKGVPVRWTIHATSKDLNGCNNPMIIPKYNIEKKLIPGDNVIEFTPEEAGTIPYSCWMGMIRSSITVVDDVSNASAIASVGVASDDGTNGSTLPSCCGQGAGAGSLPANNGAAPGGCCGAAAKNVS